MNPRDTQRTGVTALKKSGMGKRCFMVQSIKSTHDMRKAMLMSIQSYASPSLRIQQSDHAIVSLTI